MLFTSYHVLMPQLAASVLQGGPQTIGYLYAATAFGALLAAASSGWTRRILHPGRMVVVCALLLGATVVLLGLAVAATSVSLSAGFWAILAALALAGAVDTVADIVRGAMIQLHTPDALRGRVSGIWLSQSYLGPALGGLQMGGLAGWATPARALLTGGTVCLALVAAEMLRPKSVFRRSVWKASGRSENNRS